MALQKAALSRSTATGEAELPLPAHKDTARAAGKTSPTEKSARPVTSDEGSAPAAQQQPAPTMSPFDLLVYQRDVLERSILFFDTLSFCRMWEFYLAASEVAFRYCGLMVFQIQLANTQQAVPVTRDYIAVREAQLKAQDACGSTQMMVAAE